MLTLSHALHAAINDHGAASYPHEGCGLLLGHAGPDGNVVVALHRVANTWPVEAEKAYRFHIDGEAMLGAELAAMDAGLDVVGIFHSHPDSPPIASPRDLAWATWPGYSYLITAVRDGRPGLSRSWQLTADRTDFVEEDIHLLAPKEHT